MRKNILIAVLILITAFFIADRFYNWTHLTKEQKILKENQAALDGNLDAENPAKITTGANGLTYAEKAVIPTQDIKNTLSPKTLDYINQNIMPELKASAQSVEAVNKISMVASGQLPVASITLPDKTKIRISLAEKITFKDKYASIIIEKDSTGKVLPAKYQFAGELYKVTTKKKPVLFWQKPKEVDTYVFNNENFKITNIESFTKAVQPPANVFQLKAESGLQLGLKNPANSNFKAGVAAVFNQDGFISPRFGVGKIWNLSDGSADNYGQVQLDFNILKIKK